MVWTETPVAIGQLDRTRTAKSLFGATTKFNQGEQTCITKDQPSCSLAVNSQGGRLLLTQGNIGIGFSPGTKA
jgi:hypothetical protein